MLAYQFNFLSDGKTVYAAKHEFADDLDALDSAERLAQDFEIEIYYGERFVARINKGGRALNVGDACSG
jgi:hypothetical protein